MQSMTRSKRFLARSSRPRKKRSSRCGNGSSNGDTRANIKAAIRRLMKGKLISAIALGSLLVGTILAHDLFLRLDNYFVAVGQPAKISVLNGSFQASEGAVNFARLADRSVVTPSGHVSKIAEA